MTTSIATIEPPCTPGCASTPRPRVRFSQFSQMTMIPKEDDQKKSKWFSKQEQRRFRQAVLNDTRRIRDLLQNTPPQEITQDELFECVGIENFLSRDLAQQVLRKKRAHVDAILLVQRGHHLGTNKKDEEVSHTSKISSQWACERARRIAAGYATSLQN